MCDWRVTSRWGLDREILQHPTESRACTRSSAPRSHGLGTTAWVPKRHSRTASREAMLQHGEVSSSLFREVAVGNSVSLNLKGSLSMIHHCFQTNAQVAGIQGSYSVHLVPAFHQSSSRGTAQIRDLRYGPHHIRHAGHAITFLTEFSDRYRN